MSPEDNEQPDPIDSLAIGELITLAEAAKLSGLSHSYLKNLTNNGRLKAKKSGGTWLTTLAAIEEFKKSRHQGKRTDLDTRTF
jgi:excisionase family DNA binding protein